MKSSHNIWLGVRYSAGMDTAVPATCVMDRAFPPRVSHRSLVPTGSWVTKSGWFKLTLDGLTGPIEVNDVMYLGQVPMTPFRNLLSDEEIAAVLTYVRNAFGNSASQVEAEQVAAIRAATADRQGFYTVRDLIQE